MTDQEGSEAVRFGENKAVPTNERRLPLQVKIVPVTTESLTRHFPQYGEGGDSEKDTENQKRRFSEGLSYWAVAQDPETGEDVGGIFVNLEHPGNLFSVGVNESYQRRGVTKQLIQHAQKTFDRLSLENVSGLGDKIYTQMGFKPVPEKPWAMTWSRPDAKT